MTPAIRHMLDLSTIATVRHEAWPTRETVTRAKAPSVTRVPASHKVKYRATRWIPDLLNDTTEDLFCLL